MDATIGGIGVEGYAADNDDDFGRAYDRERGVDRVYDRGYEHGHGSWVQMAIEIPGFRDDDALPVFLSEMMREALVGSVGGGDSDHDHDYDSMVGGLKGRLVINRRWHWRLYIDVCLIFFFFFFVFLFIFLFTN